MTASSFLWDVVVIGGGPSGCVSAAALAGAGHRVLLAEADRRGRERLADILAPDVVRQLSAWGAFQSLPDGVAMPCRGVLARWAQREPHVTDYELLSCGSAWIVRRPAFDRVLLKRAAATGVATRLGWTSTAIHDRGGGFEVSFATPDGPSRVMTRAIMNASGRASAARAGSRVYYDRQLAYSATVDLPDSLHDFLWIESTNGGWWYLNALPGGRAQLVWVTEERPESPGPAGRCAFLGQKFASTQMVRSAFAGNPVFESVAVSDARLSACRRKPTPGIFTVGDALSTSDPLSGRGWSRAMTSAQATAEIADGYLRLADTARWVALQGRLVEDFHRHMSDRARYWTQIGIPGGAAGRAWRPL